MGFNSGFKGLITFLSPEMATSTNIHVLFSLSRIIMSGLLLGMVLSVCTCRFHNMVTLPPWLVSTDFGACSYQCFFVQLYPCFLAYVKLLLLLLLLFLLPFKFHINAVCCVDHKKTPQYTKRWQNSVAFKSSSD